MTTFTITVDNDANASILKQMLKALRFVKKIESEEDHYDLSAEEIRILDERLAKYSSGKMKFSSWEEVKKRIASRK